MDNERTTAPRPWTMGENLAGACFLLFYLFPTEAAMAIRHRIQASHKLHAH
jgi:hypothetical protein